MTEQMGQRRGKSRQKLPLGTLRCNYFIRPVVWVVMVSGASAKANWGTSAAWGEPMFVGEAWSGGGFDFPASGLGWEHVVPALAAPLKQDVFTTEKIHRC